MAEHETPRSRGGGRLFFGLAFALLLGAGGTAAWLHFTDRLAPLLAPAPLVALDLPPPAPESSVQPSPSPAASAEPAATTSDAVPASSETAASPASAVAPVATTSDGASAPSEAAPSGAAPSDAATSPTSSEAAAPVQPGSAEEPSTASLQAPPPPAPAPGSAEPAAATPAASSNTAPTAETPAAAPADASPAAASTTESSAAPAAAATTAGNDAGTAAAAATEIAAATPPPTPAPAPTLAPPWKRYARPFPIADARPRIAIVIAELGLSRAATEAAIERLPPEITLSFNPLAPNLQAWIIKARARGHEVMLDLPMEPLSYPQEDPGPNALLASLGLIENARRLEFLLDRADGYVGVASYMGSRFEGAAELIQPVLQTLADRGLLFLANRSAPATEVPALAAALKLPWLSNDRFLDTEATRVAIDGRLQQLERLARTHKGAVAMGLGYPVTIERVGAWAETLGAKGIALAPASALVGVVAP